MSMLAFQLLMMGVIAVPFLLYPALLWLRAAISSRPVQSGSVTPSVDLVICAHDESAVIADKVRNALSLDYPQEHLHIWIASDGSTDDTVRLAEEAAAGDARVRVLDLPRTGKAGALISAAESGTAEVLAFSDANSAWRKDALQRLVAPLADQSVGGVAGDQRYRDDSATSESAGERGYWSFDRRLKHWQSVAGSATSATGAIYCVRRDLFQPPPADATDDFMISTAVIHHGRRLAFAADAVAEEPPAASAGLEYQRKVRVISRGLRSVLYRRSLLNPFRTGLYALQLFVHKVWRRMVWVPLLLLLVCAPWAVAAGGLSAALSLLVLLFLGAGLMGVLFPTLRRFRAGSIPAFVLVVNLACMVATLNLLRGKRISSWRLPREAGMPR